MSPINSAGGIITNTIASTTQTKHKTAITITSTVITAMMTRLRQIATANEIGIANRAIRKALRASFLVLRQLSSTAIKHRLVADLIRSLIPLPLHFIINLINLSYISTINTVFHFPRRFARIGVPKQYHRKGGKSKEGESVCYLSHELVGSTHVVLVYP